ncbi:O-antigen ligase family protein [Comamonadaceae bacterium G21597-S1]|nr:O-antigen ligase family protein [Comamonadaceae bacterium G21597-S1]
MKPGQTRTSTTANAGIVLGFVFAAAALGLGAAIFPTGFMARLAIIVFGSVSILLAWAFRSPKNAFPESLIFTGLLLLTALSILWPRYIYLHYPGLPSISAFTFSTMAALYTVVVLLIYSPGFSQRVSHQVASSRWLVMLASLWLSWRLLASLLGDQPAYSVVIYVRELIYLTSYLLFGYCLCSIDGGQKWLMRIIVLCALVTGALGVAEALTQHNMFVGFASAGDNAELEGNLANIALEKFRGGQYRAQATFNHPIVFAQYIAAAVPIVVYSILRETSKVWRLLAILTLPIAFAAIVQSASRAGIVSVAAAIASIGIVLWLRAITHGKVSRAFAILMVPAMIGAIGIGYYLLEELALGRTAQEAGSTNIRLDMLRLGIAALQDSPLWGFGQGMAVTKAGFSNSAGVSTIDNYFLSLAIDSGYVGLGLLIILIIAFFIKGIRFSVAESGPEGLFVGACVASVAAIAVTFTILSIPNNMTMFWLLITATIPHLSNRSEKSQKQWNAKVKLSTSS